MADAPKQEIKLFYCYARRDKALRDRLEKHIGGLKQHYPLTNWHDREILPGKEWELDIHAHLNTADIILLLISPDFIASDYCYGVEMKRALERHKEGTCRVIPILLRPARWQDAPFSILQLLPRNARPITSWRNRDQAFEDVVTEISRTLKDLLISNKTKEERLKEGIASLKRYEEALTAIEQAIHLDPNNDGFFIEKGNALISLSRNEEAERAFQTASQIYYHDYNVELATIEQAIHLDPNNADLYYQKCNILDTTEDDDEEALTAIEQAIHLDPNNADFYYRKHLTLKYLDDYQEALTAIEQAIHLDPNNAHFYAEKSNALRNLSRNKEALTAIEQAIHLDPNNGDFYVEKSNALISLSRNEEAEQADQTSLQIYRANNKEPMPAIEEAIHLDPNNAHLYYQKCKILLYRHHNNEEALTAIEQAIRLDPNNGDFYYQKAMALMHHY